MTIAINVSFLFSNSSSNANFKKTVSNGSANAFNLGCIKHMSRTIDWQERMQRLKFSLCSFLSLLPQSPFYFYSCIMLWQLRACYDFDNNSKPLLCIFCCWSKTLYTQDGFSGPTSYMALRSGDEVLDRSVTHRISHHCRISFIF